MAEMDLNSITPILYEYYIPGLQPYAFSEEFFTQQLEAAQKVEQVGQNFNVKVQTGFSEGIAMSGGPTTPLPAAGSAQFKDYRGTVRTLRARIKVFRELIDYSQGFEKGAINVLDAEMNGVQEALKCEVERYGIGDAGITPIACIASAIVTNAADTWVTVTIDDGGGVAMCGNVWPTRYLRNGMMIDILKSDHTSVSGVATESQEILDVIDGTTFTIRCADHTTATALAALLADGQLIYHQDGYNAEPEGIKSMFGSLTNSLYGEADMNRATTTNSYLKPYVTVVDANGKLVSGAATGVPKTWSILRLVEFLGHLQNVCKVKKTDLKLFAEESIVNQYIAMKQADGMYVQENPKIDGWPFETVLCEGVTMLSMPYMFSNAIAAVPMTKMTKYECRKIDFVNEFGGIWNKVPGYDAAEAYLVGTYQYGCENFKQGGVMYDLKGAYDDAA